MIGRDMLTLTTPECVELIKQMVASDSYEPYEARRLRRDGSTFWAEMHTHQITVDGEILRITTLWNITGRKHAEDVIRAAHQQLSAQEEELQARIGILAENELHLRSLIDESRDGFFVIDAVGTITFANQALARLFGHAVPAEVTGRSFLEYIMPEDRERVGAYFCRAVESGATTPDKPPGIDGVRVDGSRCIVEVNASPIIEGGRITGIRGSIRKNIEQKPADPEI